MGDQQVRRIVGCMTGTSLDGLDVVLAAIEGRGLALRARYVAMMHWPLEELAEVLRGLAGGAAHRPIDYLRAARRLGELHAEAIAALCREQGIDRPDLVAAHGQTIWHAPGEHLSWQLLDPWPIVRRLGSPVCYDLRQADLVAGGEGAPITPIADPLMYGIEDAAVVNLGGICNVTHWGRWWSLRGKRWEVEGYDVCPCNVLLDGLAQRLVHEPFDRDGQVAASGEASREVVAAIDEQVRRAVGKARSLGREPFDAAWFDALLARQGEASPATWLASAVAWVAKQVAGEMNGRNPRHVILAGGGARHAELARQIAARLTEGPTCRVSDELGLPCEAREAMTFAILGALSQDGVPITLPDVTGADHPGVAGAWVGVTGRTVSPV